MTSPPLDNLVKAGSLKAEAKNEAEVRRLLAMARTRFGDAGFASLSLEGRFISAYNAAHAAALRWHGYRSENRYTIFQCLAHTLGWTAARWRILDAAHQKRNLAEYEGYFELDEASVEELRCLAGDLIVDAERLLA